MNKFIALLAGGIAIAVIILALKHENIIMMGIAMFIIGYIAGKLERPL